LAVQRSWPERRRYLRYVIGGRVTSIYDASVMDISLGGVLIEHFQIVRPGTVSYLIVRLREREVSLRCRVIRSVVHRLEATSEGERMLVYQSGLEFVDSSGEMQQLISDYISATVAGIDSPLAGL
jgi:hypothetical protein